MCIRDSSNCAIFHHIVHHYSLTRTYLGRVGCDWILRPKQAWTNCWTTHGKFQRILFLSAIMKHLKSVISQNDRKMLKNARLCKKITAGKNENALKI